MGILTELVEKGLHYIGDKNYRFSINSSLGFYDTMPDDEYLKQMFLAQTGKHLNLDNPKTFNEKLQWLKLYNRKPEYTIMVDKYRVREYIEGKIGKEYLIPLLGVWNTPDEIDFDFLPNQFVLKCNHDSGSSYICTDKSKLNVKKIKKSLWKRLKKDYYLIGREWPYKNVPRKIIAEQYIETENGDLPDYKFFTMGGKVKAMFVATDRHSSDKELKFDFFDRQYRPLDFAQGHPRSKILPQKPHSFELMCELAEKLAKEIPQVRIDFYEVNGKPLFGEMTFSHNCGMVPFEPESWDYKFGSWIQLPENNSPT